MESKGILSRIFLLLVFPFVLGTVAAFSEPQGASPSESTLPVTRPSLQQSACSPAATASPIIAQAKVTREGQKTIVQIIATGPPVSQARRLSSPERLVLDFPGAHLAVQHWPISNAVPPVRNVRVGQFKPDVARVVIDLDIQPEIRCRVLMTSTLESFTIGHTIVLSRGLLDVLPDEASLAAILATELAHVALGHRIDAQYAFFDRLLFDDKETFRHFGFSRTPEEEQAAHQKAIDLLKNSPYKDQLGAAQLFIRALQSRSEQIPSLISPHLGDRVLTNWTVSSSTAPVQIPGSQAQRTSIVALPLGGRIKLDPRSDELQMIKTPISSVAESEKMPFEVTPFLPYLTRQGEIR